MKALFIGEFSGAYSEVIPALKEKGVEVFHIAGPDGYKGYKSDFKLYSAAPKKVLTPISTLLGIRGLKQFVLNWSVLKKHSRGFDIVQINCPNPFDFGFIVNLFYFRYLYKHNKALYLSVLGANYYVNKRMINMGHRMFKTENVFQKFKRDLFLYVRLKITTDYLNKRCRAVMPMSYSYKDAYKNFDNVTEIVPIGLKSDRIGTPLNVKSGDVIKIFHGWQKGRESNKGNDVFDKVIKRIVEKYGKKVEYQIVQNVPYEKYVKMFSGCHIFIDQLYAEDKGINGLLGMAAGKVVFSGFKAYALALYPEYDGRQIGIECHDDENDLFEKFCKLIENPEQMNIISNNAIDFIKKYHLNTVVADQYLHIWNASL